MNYDVQGIPLFSLEPFRSDLMDKIYRLCAIYDYCASVNSLQFQSRHWLGFGVSLKRSQALNVNSGLLQPIYMHIEMKQNEKNRPTQDQTRRYISGFILRRKQTPEFISTIFLKQGGFVVHPYRRSLRNGKGSYYLCCPRISKGSEIKLLVI